MKSKMARNLGAYLDETMDMKDHISHTIRSCYSQLRSIAKIRGYLTTDSVQKIVHAFVTSRMDTFNSLLIQLPQCPVKRFQLIQNNVARLVMKKKRNCSITPVLKDLHWLPVEYKVQNKVPLQEYKYLCDKAPAYLSQLLKRYTPKKNLRSSKEYQLRHLCAEGVWITCICDGWSSAVQYSPHNH